MAKETTEAKSLDAFLADCLAEMREVKFKRSILGDFLGHKDVTKAVENLAIAVLANHLLGAEGESSAKQAECKQGLYDTLHGISGAFANLNENVNSIEETIAAKARELYPHTLKDAAAGADTEHSAMNEWTRRVQEDTVNEAAGLGFGKGGKGVAG